MTAPSIPTIKRLYAVSGNRCAFPNCKLTLVDAPSGKVTGRIAHICARQPGGPRYDASQADEQRHSFENLLLLCPIHHDVIDDDPVSYTVDRLHKIKDDHEASQTGARSEVAGDEVAKQLLVSISQNTVTHGSIIFSQNQMGGQVAHSIQNVGPQPRRFSNAAASALVADLKRHPAETIKLTCIMGDSEGFQLASNLKGVLELSGWHVNGVNQALFTAPVVGVELETPEARPGVELLGNWLQATGMKPRGIIRPDSTSVSLLIGGNL